MINFDHVTKDNIKQDNSNWSKTSDHPYRIFVTGGPGLEKRIHYLIQ